jgi:hypothetical protein
LASFSIGALQPEIAAAINNDAESKVLFFILSSGTSYLDIHPCQQQYPKLRPDMLPEWMLISQPNLA